MDDTSRQDQGQDPDEFSVNPFLTEQRRQELRQGKTEWQIGDDMATTAENLSKAGLGPVADALDVAAIKAYYEAMGHGYNGPDAPYGDPLSGNPDPETPSDD